MKSLGFGQEISQGDIEEQLKESGFTGIVTLHETSNLLFVPRDFIPEEGLIKGGQFGQESIYWERIAEVKKFHCLAYRTEGKYDTFHNFLESLLVSSKNFSREPIEGYYCRGGLGNVAIDLNVQYGERVICDGKFPARMSSYYAKFMQDLVSAAKILTPKTPIIVNQVQEIIKP